MNRPEGHVDAELAALIERTLDGRASPAEQTRLADRLRLDPGLAAAFAEDRRLQTVLQRAVPDPAPARVAAILQRSRDGTRARALPPARIAAMLAVFALGLGTGIGADRTLSSRAVLSGTTSFAETARAAHALYVPEVRHPVEVAADERDHLQTWLSKRLGAPIIAPHLGDTGYHLIGGRLLPDGERAAALFMYENDSGDRISLYATHGGEGPDSAFRFYAEGGYTCVSWQDGPWQYALIGDLSRENLDRIARDVHEQMT